MKVSIIIPVIRPEKVRRCIEAIRMNTGLFSNDYEILMEEDVDRIGCPKMVKKLVERSKYEYVCFLGDDTIPQIDFLKNALRAMKHIPGEHGLVSFNDNPTTTRSCAHWVASKKLLPELGGEFFHTGYKHCFCDDELMVRCQLMNKYIYAYDAIVKHDHFIFGDGKPDDEDMKKVYSDKIYQADRALFEIRRNNEWKTPKIDTRKTYKVLVGIPSGDMVFAGFAMNLVAMTSYCIQTGIHVATINQNSSIIEVGRNTIVQNAIELGADYLLTIDSDMTFPASLVHNLLAHGKDLVCCNASTRREPFRPVCKGVDEELLGINQGLVEVKGGTSAVQLVSVEALKKFSPPHYAVSWDDKTGLKFVGEDYFFYEKAREAGITPYCDTDIKIGHLGIKEYFIEEE